jgi:hypothetical protein
MKQQPLTLSWNIVNWQNNAIANRDSRLYIAVPDSDIQKKLKRKWMLFLGRHIKLATLRMNQGSIYHHRLMYIPFRFHFSFTRPSFGRCKMSSPIKRTLSYTCRYIRKYHAVDSILLRMAQFHDPLKKDQLTHEVTRGWRRCKMCLLCIKDERLKLCPVSFHPVGNRQASWR